VSSKIHKEQVKERFSFHQVIFMKDSGKIIGPMVKEYLNLMMAQFMKASLRMMSSLKASLHLLMVLKHTKVHSMTISLMDMANWKKRENSCMKANSKIICDKVMGL